MRNPTVISATHVGVRLRKKPELVMEHKRPTIGPGAIHNAVAAADTTTDNVHCN